MRPGDGGAGPLPLPLPLPTPARKARLYRELALAEAARSGRDPAHVVAAVAAVLALAQGRPAAAVLRQGGPTQVNATIQIDGGSLQKFILGTAVIPLTKAAEQVGNRGRLAGA